MAEVMWILFLFGAGLLWVGLVYVSWDSAGSRGVHRYRPVWEVLLWGEASGCGEKTGRR